MTTSSTYFENPMPHVTSIIITLIFLGMASLFRPSVGQEAPAALEAVPLVANGIYDTPLGQFALMAWSVKEKFPAVVSCVPYKKGSHGRMSFGQVEDSLNIHNEGRAKQVSDYDFAGMVTFAPKQPGVYALQGTLRCVSGAKAAEDVDNVTWAVVVYGLQPERFKVVYQENRGRKDRVFAFENYPQLQTIELAADERVGITVWRHKWQWYGGGQLQNVRIALAADRDWQTGTPPTDDDLSGPIGLPFQRDFAAGDELSVKLGLSGYSPSAVTYAEFNGKRQLDIAIRGVNWSTMAIPGARLFKGRHYQLHINGQCVDQVEIIEGSLPSIGDFTWRADPRLREWKIQFSPPADMTLDEIKWRFRGSGHWYLQALAITQIPAFTVTPAEGESEIKAGKQSSAELLGNSTFALGGTGWQHGWNTVFTQRQPEAFGSYSWQQGRPLWTVPAGGVPNSEGEAQDFITVFNTTPLLLNFGGSYTVHVDADAPVTLKLRHHGSVVQTWEFIPGQPAQQTFTLTPPAHGVFEPGAHPLFYIEAEVKAPNIVRRISFAQGSAIAAEPKETGVALRDQNDIYDHRVRTGHDIALRVSLSPGVSAAEASLVITDHQNREWRRIPLSITGHQFEVETASLLPGWYEVRCEVSGAQADRMPLVVLPDENLAARNQHLGMRQNGGFGRITIAGKRQWRNWYDPNKLRASVDIGLSKVKMFNGWSESEPTKGDWTFGRDDNMDMLIDQHIEVVLVLGSAPVWARREGADTPQDLTAWEHAVRVMAEHWQGKVRHFIVWNEPDLHRVPVDLHVDLCRRAYRILKDVDPNCVVIAGCTTTSGRAYMMENIEAGLLNYCDVLGFHGYVREQSAHFGPGSFVDFVAPLQAAMRKRSAVKPIWDMEAGFNFGIDEGLAGAAMSEVYLKGLVTRQVAGITRYYGWGSEDIGWPGGGHFSMFFGQKKEPLISQALTAGFVAMVGDAAYVATLGDDEAGTHVYQFQTAQGETVLIGWHSLPESECAFPQSVLSTVQTYDDMGRPLAQSLTAPALAANVLTLTAELRYFTAVVHP